MSGKANVVGRRLQAEQVMTMFALPGVFVRVRTIGDDGNAIRRQAGAQHRVFLACVADADDSVAVRQAELQHLVHGDAGDVGESEQRVVRENCLPHIICPAKDASLRKQLSVAVLVWKRITIRTQSTFHDGG